MDKKRIAEINKGIDFFEELLWLMESKKNIKTKDIPMQLRDLLNENNNNEELFNYKYTAENSNKNYLIGVLPRLFKDKDLFPNNLALIDFANQVLKLNLSSDGKRGRNEIIGNIICETDDLSDDNLKLLVKFLVKLAGNEESMNQLKVTSKNNFSWNEAIQKMVGSQND